MARPHLAPCIPLQEHTEKMAAAHADAEDRLALERDLRYQQRSRDQDRAVETALLAAEKAINAALLAQEKAVSKAETATDKRFEGVNEFRSALGDLATKQVSRDEYLQGMSNLADKIDSLSKVQDRQQGRAGGSLDQRTLFLALPGVAAALLTVLLSILLLTRP